jgi:hypothetical protein
MKLNVKFLPYLAILVISILSGLYVDNKISVKNREIEHLKVDLAHAQIYQPLQYDTIRDSVLVPMAPVVTMSHSSFKKIVDKQLLKDIGVKTGQISEQQNTEAVTADTVYLIKNVDSIFVYQDKWASFQLTLKTNKLNYTIRDSITTIVYREYKHHFLFWKWGTKGYKVKVVNFNPHSTLLYNQYLKIG